MSERLVVEGVRPRLDTEGALIKQSTNHDRTHSHTKYIAGPNPLSNRFLEPPKRGQQEMIGSTPKALTKNSST
jgi:hypothetical protein